MPFGKSFYNNNENNCITLCSYRTSQDLKPSSSISTCQSAVQVRKLRLTYGRGHNTKVILDSIDLTVPDSAM